MERSTSEEGNLGEEGSEGGSDTSKGDGATDVASSTGELGGNTVEIY